jgi:hypothetical protein
VKIVSYIEELFDFLFIAMKYHETILENNVFEFNGKLYKQQIGTAMGSVPSPEVCDILMFDILEEIYNRFQFKHKIYYSGRYRDDGFMIFHSNEEEIEQFFNIANNFHQSIKFTFNKMSNIRISQTSGEGTLPIAVPICCLYSFPLNSKTLFSRMHFNKYIISFVGGLFRSYFV